VQFTVNLRQQLSRSNYNYVDIYSHVPGLYTAAGPSIIILFYCWMSPSKYSSILYMCVPCCVVYDCGVDEPVGSFGEALIVQQVLCARQTRGHGRLSFVEFPIWLYATPATIWRRSATGSPGENICLDLIFSINYARRHLPMYVSNCRYSSDTLFRLIYVEYHFPYAFLISFSCNPGIFSLLRLFVLILIFL
jgi:hypothetical protein